VATDVSVVFKGDSQQFTNSTKQAADATRRLDSDVKQTQRTLDTFAAAQKKVDAWQQWQRASEALKQYQRDIKNAKYAMDDATKTSLAQQTAEVEKLKATYQSLSKEVANAAKEEVNMRDQMSKTDNDMMSRTGGGSGGEFGGGIGATLVRMRLFAQLGQAFQGYVGELGKSSYGNITGSAISNILGGAASGFTMGLYTGNPYIMAAGAAVGATSGVIQTATEKLTRTDDAFRAEVENLYNNVTQERELALQAGIEYASTEEANLRAMGILLGNQQKGNQLYQELKSYGINTMYQTPNMLTSAKRMLAYGVDESQIMQAVKWIGDIAMGDQSKFDSLAYVYGQTASAGKLTGQDLRQYTEAGFNPLAWLAEERGVSLEAMREEMSAGKVLYQDVMHAFELATAEGAKFGGSAAAMMDTYAGKLSKLSDIQANIEGGYGRGYNEEREKGLDYEIKQLEGETGTYLEQANRLIGAYEADLENQHQQALIDAQTEVLNSEDFKKIAMTNAPEAGRMLAEAKTRAEIEWQNSEGMQMKREADLALVTGIQNDLALNMGYVEYGIKMADAFTLGFSGVYNRNMQDIMTLDEQYSENPIGMFKDFVSGKISPKTVFSWYLNGDPYKNLPNYSYYQNHDYNNTWLRPDNSRADKYEDIRVRAKEVIAEGLNTNQTNNVSVSVTINEAEKASPDIGSMIARAVVGAIGKSGGTTSKSTGWAQRLGGR